MTWEQAKYAARREYNRVNAARARQRHKEEAETRDQRIAELQSQVEQLTRLNEVLMNYICELQASANTNSAAQIGTAYNHALVDAASIDTKATASNGIPPSTSNSAMQAATHSALMWLLKEKGVSESPQAQLTQMKHHESNASALQSRKSYTNDASTNLTGATASSIGPIMRALQAQQLLADSAKSNHPAAPWNTFPGAPATVQNQTSNSLWDIILSIQQLQHLLPSSSAPN
jgi:hypothetical protein